MNTLLRREESTTGSVQEDETLPECLRSYQPFVLLWSEQQEQAGPDTSWCFSEDYGGIGVANVECLSHDHFSSTPDGNGGFFADTVFD